MTARTLRRLRRHGVSYAGALAITRLLALETMRRLGPRARPRLGSIETVQDRLRELE